jgi:hypothetical protein
MPSPKELTRSEVLDTARTFRWTKKMPKWRVVVNGRELPARPLVLEAAGVAPNDTTNSHQAVAILESLGFEIRYTIETRATATVNTRATEDRDSQESIVDIVSRVSGTVPDSEWAKLPTDLAKNLDHYLYGHKKVKG